MPLPEEKACPGGGGPGRSGGGPGWSGGGPGWRRGAGYRWASAIDLIYRIKMVVVRASGTVRASSLKQNIFLTLEWHLRPALFRGGVLPATFLGGTMGGHPRKVCNTPWGGHLDFGTFQPPPT